MRITTRFFGEIEIDDQKILHFEEGLIGFENLKKFTLIYNSEGEHLVIFLSHISDIFLVA